MRDTDMITNTKLQRHWGDTAPEVTAVHKCTRCK